MQLFENMWPFEKMSSKSLRLFYISSWPEVHPYMPAPILRLQCQGKHLGWTWIVLLVLWRRHWKTSAFLKQPDESTWELLPVLRAVLQVWQQSYWSQPASAQGLLPLLLFRWISHEPYCLRSMHNAKQSYKIIVLAIQGLKYGAKEVV